VDNPNRTLKLDDSFFRVKQCFSAFKDKWLELKLPAGVDQSTLGTYIGGIILPTIADALRRDNFNIASFGDKTSASAHWKQTDGMWKQLIDGVSTYEVQRSATITALSQTAGERALDYFVQAIVGATPAFKTYMAPKAILCTGNLYENLQETWERSQLTLGTLGLSVSGDTFRLRNVPIIPIWAWSDALTDATNPFHSTLDTGFIYTSLDNHVIGIDGSGQQIRQWYENKDRQVYWEGGYGFGYTFVHPDMTTIGYGKVES
jgi:hypothetical protein